MLSAFEIAVCDELAELLKRFSASGGSCSSLETLTTPRDDLDEDRTRNRGAGRDDVDPTETR